MLSIFLLLSFLYSFRKDRKISFKGVEKWKRKTIKRNENWTWQIELGVKAPDQITHHTSPPSSLSKHANPKNRYRVWQKGKLDFSVIETAPKPVRTESGILVALFCRELELCFRPPPTMLLTIHRNSWCVFGRTRNGKRLVRVGVKSKGDLRRSTRKKRKAWHNTPKRWRPEGSKLHEMKTNGNFYDSPCRSSFAHMLLLLSVLASISKCRNNKQASRRHSISCLFSRSQWPSPVGVGEGVSETYF